MSVDHDLVVQDFKLSWLLPALTDSEVVVIVSPGLLPNPSLLATGFASFPKKNCERVDAPCRSRESEGKAHLSVSVEPALTGSNPFRDS